jgi:hypothetical protein
MICAIPTKFAFTDFSAKIAWRLYRTPLAKIADEYLTIF